MNAQQDTEASPIYDDPAQVVRAFIADMHEWELSASAAMRAAEATPHPAAYQKPILATMKEVFLRWCTPKERKYGRLGSFSTPPEYQPEHEKILSIMHESARRVAVYTQQGTGFKHRRMYILLKKADKWLIDSVKWQLPEGKWTNGIL